MPRLGALPLFPVSSLTEHLDAESACRQSELRAALIHRCAVQMRAEMLQDGQPPLADSQSALSAVEVPGLSDLRAFLNRQ